MNVSPETYNKLSKLTVAYLENGKEVNNPMPSSLHRPRPKDQSLQAQIQRCIRNELSLQAEIQGHETWEEAEDFEMEEDDITNNLTQYEKMAEESENEPLSLLLKQQSSDSSSNPDHDPEEKGRDATEEQNTEGANNQKESYKMESSEKKSD